MFECVVASRENLQPLHRHQILFVCPKEASGIQLHYSAVSFLIDADLSEHLNSGDGQ